MKFARSSLRIHYENYRSAFEFDESPVRQWNFTIDIAPDDPDLDVDEYVLVGRGEALIVELDGRDPFDAMDEHSQAAMEIAEHVFDVDGGGVQEDLAEKLEQFGDRVLVMSVLEIEERWRGQGLGPVIAGTVIDSLSAGALAVVCKPAPLHRPIGPDGEPRDFEPGEFDRGAARLARLWSVLGFEHHAGGIHYIDPALVTFGRNFRALMVEYLGSEEPLEPGGPAEPRRPLHLV